ncbi:MAG: DHH family phosphoesterase [Bacteroidetes bacterium]|nr:DHH family phosphoesterase [Bacteroidota bacterium]
MQLFKTETDKKIIITTHHKPDADALGSSLGLYNYLKKREYNHVQVITPTDYPTFLNWMSGNDTVIIYENEVAKSNQLIADADYIFCLDFNSLKRINEMGHEVADSAATKIMIDHHQLPDDFAQYKNSRISASSTAERIQLAALIVDRTVKVKMSFRGKGTFPCNLFSKEYFSGGGHFNAAGGESDKPLDEVIKDFRTHILNYKKYLN